MVLLRSVSSADTNPITGTVVFRRVYWLNPVTPGDTVVIQNASGTTELSLRCESANQSQFLDFENEGLEVVGGYKVSTIASGTLYLYG